MSYDPREWTKVRERVPDSLNYPHEMTRISHGAYGSVYDIIGTSCVMKVMNKNEKTEKTEKIFDNEVSIGSLKGIGEVGPRIYGYKKTPTQLMYVMDNVAKMNKCINCTAVTVNEYFGRNVCLSRKHPFYQMMYNTLVNFYTITRGWHGDLHGGNIMVILDQTGALKSVKIIDYGAHQKFSNGNNVPDCLEDIFKKINQNFNAKKGTLEQIQSLPIYKKRGNAQPFKKNQNTIKHGFSNTQLLEILRDINKQKKINMLDVHVIRANSHLFKGSAVKCLEFKTAQVFYLTENREIAEKYYANPYLCDFVTKKDLKLFNLSFQNILRLIMSTNLGLSNYTKNKLKLVTGVSITEKNQIDMLKLYTNYTKNPTIQSTINSINKLKYTNTPSAPGSRLSIRNTNKDAFGSLCKEFLTPNGFDGYYAPDLASRYHGIFHSEIMLCNANKILRVRTEHEKNSFSLYKKSNLSDINLYNTNSPDEIITDAFTEWLLLSRTGIKFTKYMFPGATTFLTGGMAVKFYLESKNVPSHKIPKSNDFDISVSINNRNLIGTSRDVLNTCIQKIRDKIEPILNAFLQDVRNKIRYKILKTARLDFTTYTPTQFPRLQNSTTERYVYQVLRYFITGVTNKPIEFVDVALCYIPGANDMVKESISKVPFPMLKSVYMLRDIASVFTKSFISTNNLNKIRNPINGEKKEKGLKNYNRIKTLCDTINTNSSKNKICKNMTNLKTIINSSNKNQTTKKSNAIKLIRNKNILKNIKNLKPSR